MFLPGTKRQLTGHHYSQSMCSFMLAWNMTFSMSSKVGRLTGLVVKVSASKAEDPEFFRVESYQWLKIGTLVATLPGTWCYRVSAGTGWPGVSILWLVEMESWICNFYLSVAAHAIVWADPSLRYTRCCWDVKQASNQPTSKVKNLTPGSHESHSIWSKCHKKGSAWRKWGNQIKGY